MKTLDKNSKAIESLLKTDFRKTVSALEDIQIEVNQQNEELYLTGHESLLFRMYDLEEEDLFI